MKKYAGRHDEAAKQVAEHERRQKENHAAYEQLFTDVLKPTMEQIALQLKREGHVAEIRQKKLTNAQTGETHLGEIKFEILPADVPREHFRADEIPGVSFVPQGSQVAVYGRWGGVKRTGGLPADEIGKYDIKAVTSELVAAKVIDVLHKMLA